MSNASWPWNAGALQHALQAPLPGVRVIALDSVDSTSTWVHDALRRGDAPALLVVARAQTRGRGRNGHVWQSVPEASLTFSLGLPLAPVDWSGLSLAVGVALADAIEPLAVDGPGTVPRLQLKWPNDLWLADGDGAWRKLGGILVETVTVGADRACVVGIGLNVLHSATLPGLASGYACVQELDPTCTAPDVLARVALPLVAALRRFERDGLAPFATAFARRDLLRGHTVSTSMRAVPQGVADGVDACGALRVRHAGEVVLVHSGEVSVRPVHMAAGA